MRAASAALIHPPTILAFICGPAHPRATGDAASPAAGWSAQVVAAADCLAHARIRSAARRRPVALRRQLRQGAPGRDGVGVVGAEDALADGEGAFDEEAGGGRVALVPDEAGEVVEVRGGVEVIGAEGVAGRAAW